MIDTVNFKKWLAENTSYSSAVISDIASRAKRADSIHEWTEDDIYLYRLNNTPKFCELSVNVKSQLRKAIKLYSEFQNKSQERSV